MKRFWVLTAVLVGFGGVALMPSVTTAATAAKTTAASQVPLDRQAIISLAEKVADYQLATLAAGEMPLKAAFESNDPKGWVQGALFVGLNDLADHSSKPHYRQVILSRGAANKWELGKRLYHADDHVIGQSYLWAYRHGAGDAAIGPMRQSFDQILAARPDVPLDIRPKLPEGSRGCFDRWCWCDAIFMAPAAWLELSKVTGDKRYADYAKQEFQATTDYLYDKDEHLYFRDSRFFERRDVNGKKVFWSRGNGWVMAGLARMIPLLPQGDPDRVRMEIIFKAMAVKLKTIQKADGFWAPSLLGDPKTALPESSGTGFYTYALAWGVKAGILDRAEFEPAIRKGWAAMVSSVHDDGRLGYVQPISDRPDNVSFDDTQFYGVGAFLLAATAVADLDLKVPVAKP